MKIIYEGKLKKNNTHFCVQEMELADIDALVNLQNLVAKDIIDPSTLQPLTLDELNYILTGQGLIIGAYVGKQLIAFRALLVPPADEDYLSPLIGIEKADRNKVIYQEISIVHPDYQGNRLQQKLAKIIMKELNKNKHAYKYLCSTVSPSNIPSLKDKFYQNMEVYALKEVYPNKLRYVFSKRLADHEQRNWQESATIPVTNITKQQILLDEGWIGYQMLETDEGYSVVFGR